MRSLTLLVVLTACGSSSDDPPGDGPPTPEPCVATDDTVPLGAATQWSLKATAVDEAGPWFVLAKQHDEVTDFVIADLAGERAAPITGIPDAIGSDVAAVNFGGKRCFAMSTFDGSFHFVCEGGTVEIPDLDLDGPMFAIADGSDLHVFGQDFAAYHELRRTGGTWAPIEKFESSISKPQDAVRFQANVTSCFLSTGDNASIDTLSGDPIYGEGTATWCRLIPNDDELGVLTNLGFTPFTGGTLGGWQPAAADVPPLAVGQREGSPFAVIKRDDRIELQPLPTGTPTTLQSIEDSFDTFHANVTGDRVHITSLASTFENGMTTARVTSSTRCLE